MNDRGEGGGGQEWRPASDPVPSLCFSGSSPVVPSHHHSGSCPASLLLLLLRVLLQPAGAPRKGEHGMWPQGAAWEAGVGGCTSLWCVAAGCYTGSRYGDHTPLHGHALQMVGASHFPLPTALVGPCGHALCPHVLLPIRDTKNILPSSYFQFSCDNSKLISSIL